MHTSWIRRGRRSALLLVAALVATLAVSPGPAGADANEAPSAPAGFRSITAGYGHTCALLDNATVKCWGYNGQGQLGRGAPGDRGTSSGHMGDNLLPVDLGTGRTALAVSAGSLHTCAVLDDHTVKCWGDNTFGQLGQGDTTTRGLGATDMGDNLPPVDLGPGRTALAVSAGTNHTCALLDDHTVKCWGRGNFGILGNGATANIGDGPMEMGVSLPAIDLGTGRTVAAVAAGGEHTCALLDDATVKCWGANAGELGLGDTDHRGDVPGEMGNSLPAVALGSGGATAVVTGAYTSCALLASGDVKCWGYNTNGELGQGTTDVIGDQPGEVTALTPVQLGATRTATAISAGQNHTCALLDDDSVKCWGGNSFGQLGQGDTAARGDGAGEMGNNLPAIALSSSHVPIAISTGLEHSCAILDNHSLKCWGSALNGRLGIGSLGSNFYRGDQANEMGNFLSAVNLGTGRTVIPRARVGVAITGGDTSVVAGQDIGYEISITNTGGLPLTGVTVQAPDVPACGQPVADMAPGVLIAITCPYTTTVDDVPVMTNQVLVTTDQGVFALSGTRRTRVDPVMLRPDAQIRLAAGAFAGDGTYNTNGAGQARATTVGNLGTGTFTVRVQNDGNTTETFTVQGLGTTSRYTVTYKNGPTNITAAVVAGTFTTDPLAPGDFQDLTLTIKAKAGTPVGNALSRTVTITSVTNITIKDAVKATVTRR